MDQAWKFKITHRYIIVGIGNEAVEFHFWEYLSKILGTVSLQCNIKYLKRDKICETYWKTVFNEL